MQLASFKSRTALFSLVFVSRTTATPTKEGWRTCTIYDRYTGSSVRLPAGLLCCDRWDSVSLPPCVTVAHFFRVGNTYCMSLPTHTGTTGLIINLRRLDKYHCMHTLYLTTVSRPASGATCVTPDQRTDPIYPVSTMPCPIGVVYCDTCYHGANDGA